MTTRLVDIYTTLAAMPVTLDSSAVPVRDLHQLLDAVYNTDTPVRLLFPPGAWTGTRSTFTPLTLAGGRGTVVHTLVDLFLLKPAGASEGLEVEMPALTAYIAAYNRAMLVTGFRLGHAATVESMTLEPTVVAYPAGSTTQYYAVEVRLTVKELV